MRDARTPRYFCMSYFVKLLFKSLPPEINPKLGHKTSLTIRSGLGHRYSDFEVPQQLKHQFPIHYMK